MSDQLEKAKQHHKILMNCLPDGSYTKQLGGLIAEVESLTKELKLQEQDNYRIIQSSKAAHESLTKKRDECERQYQEKVAEIGVMLDEKIKLEAENASLKEERDKLYSRLDSAGAYHIDQRELMRKELAASEKARLGVEAKLMSARTYMTTSQEAEMDCLFDENYLKDETQ